MIAFVDTSALLALLDRDDQHHADAITAWQTLAEGEATLVTTNYVVLETIAVGQHRLGLDAVRAWTSDVAPLLDVEFVDEALHRAALSTLLAADRRQLSLVDCVSFEVMRRRGLRHAFAYDRHFSEQGFVAVSGITPPE
jgi:predicted nucleic acid-binding protein